MERATGQDKVKKDRGSRSTAPVLVRRRDSVDIFERVLTRGAVVKGVDAAVDEDTVGESETRESTWLRVSISGVDLLNVQTVVSWQSWDAPHERRATTEREA